MISTTQMDAAHAVYAMTHKKEVPMKFEVHIKFDELERKVLVEATSMMTAMNEVYVNRVRAKSFKTLRDATKDSLGRYEVLVDVCGDEVKLEVDANNPYEVLHNVSGTHLKVLGAVEVAPENTPQ